MIMMIMTTVVGLHLVRSPNDSYICNSYVKYKYFLYIAENISVIKKEIDADLLEQTPAVVACLTMDFAMQNVLKQIGLNVIALDGRVIKQMKTFIFRCYACFKTTSIMTKVFCPSCGNKTLKKVAVTLNEEGKQQIHINFRKSISKKGKRVRLLFFFFFYLLLCT